LSLTKISNASFLGKLLVLPANVRLDWKVIASYKHSSLFGLVVSDEGKKLNNIDPQDGAADGLYFLFVPKFDKLLDFTVWRKAAEQVLNFYGLVQCLWVKPGSVFTTLHFLCNLRMGKKLKCFITLGWKGFQGTNTLDHWTHL
jgi:hypothetical protein